jgi:hypothetical protein
MLQELGLVRFPINQLGPAGGLRRMGLRRGGRRLGARGPKRPPAGRGANLIIQTGWKGWTFRRGWQPGRLGRAYADVSHILLLPTGLAVGLGQEVNLPYRKGGFAPKDWVPRSSGWVPENSAAGLAIRFSRLKNNLAFWGWLSMEISRLRLVIKEDGGGWEEMPRLFFLVSKLRLGKVDGGPGPP